MKFPPLLLLCILWSQVEVHSLTFPYVSFMGHALPNNSYINFSLVGTDKSGNDSNTVKCHTDLSTCCRADHGVHRGDWHYPNGTRLPFPSSRGVLYMDRKSEHVDLYRDGNGPTSGIYHCTIATNAVHDDSDQSLGESVYVGLYTSGGDITISEELTLTINSDLNGASPQFTLTCISTGGPATTVTWTRDSGPAMGNKMTVLNNATTAQYTHALTVTRRLGGLYTCTVANNKPSEDSATYTVRVASAPTNLMAVQEGPTSIRVSWSPPTPLGDTTGYRIYFSRGSNSSEDASDSFTDNYLLTGLKNGDIYMVSIVATSQHFFSNTVFLNVTLVSKPSVTAINVTSISLAWSDSAVDSYEVIWMSDECPGGVLSGSTTVSSTNYTIQNLRGGTGYTVTVSPTILAGFVFSNPVIIYTVEYKPSAAPTSVGVVAVTSSSITVQWRAVDCIHHNGNITGYSIQYGVEGSQSTQIVHVSGGNVTEATILSLMSSTTYSIEVAAVNSGGNGDYSHPVTAQTAENSQSGVDMTASVTGGVAVVVVLIIAGTSIVVVVLVLRYHRRNDSTEIQKKGPQNDSDIPTSTNAVYELTRSGSYTVHQPTEQQTTNSFQCKCPESDVDIPTSTNVVYELTRSGSYTVHQPTEQQTANSFQCKCPESDSEVDIPASTNAIYEVIELMGLDQLTAQQTTNTYSSSPSAGIYELV